MYPCAWLFIVKVLAYSRLGTDCPHGPNPADPFGGGRRMGHCRDERLQVQDTLIAHACFLNILGIVFIAACSRAFESVERRKGLSWNTTTP